MSKSANIFEVLEKVESFVAGFEGDETQEGFSELLDEVMDITAQLQAPSLEGVVAGVAMSAAATVAGVILN